MTQSLVIKIDCDASSTVLTVLDAFQQAGKSVIFAKSAEHLDIDTPHKDSYELFEAGLDFAMLVTDKHRYLKSQQDLSGYFLSLPDLLQDPAVASDIDWVLQDGDVYPTDVLLTAAEGYLVDKLGKTYSLQDLSALIKWLEVCHEKKRKKI